jgi:deazaflavin-dependent oxidoreductase (nitroreductase family)
MGEMSRLEGESFCYLTTRGRSTGNPHTIEIWFALRGSSVYLLSGGQDRSDWVKNLLRNPRVEVRIADQEFSGTARPVDDPDEDAWARGALVEKYRPGYSGDLTNWGRDSLPIAVDLETEEA